MEKVSPKFLENAKEVALKAVDSSAKIALDFRENLNELPKERKDKSDTSFVTKADLEIQKNIFKIISQSYPDHRFIAEEKYSERIKQFNEENMESEWVWVVDPIDGTRKFLDKNSNYYGIAVSLLKEGYPVLSVFYAPEYKLNDEDKGVLFEASQIERTRVNGRGASVSPSLNFGSEQAVISKTIEEEVPDWEALFASHFQKYWERTGSGTLSLCRVAFSGSGREPILYVFGKTHICNVVAGGYLVDRAGGVCQNVYGKEIFPVDQSILREEIPEISSVIAGHAKVVNRFTSLSRSCKLPRVKVMGFRAKGVKEIDPENPELTMGELVSAPALKRYSNQDDIISSIFNWSEENNENPKVLRALKKMGEKLGSVIEKLLAWKYWKNTERIFIGGGLAKGEVGDVLLKSARRYISSQIDMRKIHHEPEVAGLIGGSYMVPPEGKREKMISVDLGGAKVRAGIVSSPRKEAKVFTKRVRNWKNLNLDRGSLANLVASLILECLEKCENPGEISEYICVGCPGMIDDRGNIIEGASNLPGDWTYPEFHLPSVIRSELRETSFDEFKFIMRNDAVVQGLSEIPFTQDVKEWGILTIGTGLGNAKFLNY